MPQNLYKTLAAESMGKKGGGGGSGEPLLKYHT